MLFSLLYKNASNEQTIVNLSGSNMSAAILYCDANNFTPQQISFQNINLLLNNPSLTDAYLVNMKDTETAASSSYLIYDTFSNVQSWINTQTDKVVINLTLQTRAFVQA